MAGKPITTIPVAEPSHMHKASIKTVPLEQGDETRGNSVEEDY